MMMMMMMMMMMILIISSSSSSFIYWMDFYTLVVDHSRFQGEKNPKKFIKLLYGIANHYLDEKERVRV